MANRNRLHHLALLGLLALTLTASSLAGSAQGQAESLNRLDRYIKSAIKDWDIPGLALAIVKDDRILHQRGFGVRQIGAQAPVDRHTLFAVASNTKAFTATALGLLVQEGKLSWDDPVTEVSPDFQLYDPVATEKIRVRDLLCHRSGLGLWAGDLTWWDSNYDRAEVIRRIRFQKPVSDFRTTYHYTNLMFLVAGELIPQVTGISWDRFIKQRFFEPLNMHRSNTSVKALSRMDNVATPHSVLNGKLTAIDYLNVDNCAPAAAINSSVADLSQWVRLQLNDGLYEGKRLVASPIIQETRRPHVLRNLSNKMRQRHPSIHFSTYGLGFGLHDYQGRLVVNHTGGLDGMVSYVGFMPEEDLGVIVLTNSVDHEIHRALPLYVFDMFLDEDETDWSGIYLEDFKRSRARQKAQTQKRLANRPQDNSPDRPLERYTGTFVSSVYGSACIAEKAGQLKMTLSAHPGFEASLAHWKDDTCVARWNEALWGESDVQFEFDRHGRLTRFSMAVRPDWIDTLKYSFVKID